MKLKFFTAEDLDINVKATIHKTGKIGFTAEAAKKMQLSIYDSADIAINEDDNTDDNLYVVLRDELDGAGLFKISKAGAYYYINAKPLFDKLQLPYMIYSVVYDISTEDINGQTVFVFKKRVRKVVDEEDE